GFEPPTSWSRTRRANRAALRPALLDALTRRRIDAQHKPAVVPPVRLLRLSRLCVQLDAPRRTRTPSLLIRSQALYPVELWALKNCGLAISDCGLTAGRLPGGPNALRCTPSAIHNPQSAILAWAVLDSN